MQMLEYFPKDTFLFVINAILYIITLSFFYRMNKKSVGFFLMILYTISAILAIVYFAIYASINNEVYNLDIKSFLYLYFCIMIGLWPFVKLKSISNISIGDNEYRLFVYLVYLVIVISIEPFIENFILLFKPHDSYQLHIDVVEGELKIYSSLANRLNTYSIHFRSFIPIATIIIYKIKESPVLLKYGILIPNINYLLIHRSNCHF